MQMRGTVNIATVLLCLAAAVGAQETGPSGPKLMVPEKVIDEGTVAKGTVVEANFKLVNEGTETLVVKAVRPTCGCTVADYDREVSAGGEGWLKAKLDTADFSGPVSKSILVMTNDPQDPTITLVIKAVVKPYIEVLPRPLIRFNAVTYEGMSQTVTVVSDDDERDFKVTNVESSVPYLETSVRKLGSDELLRGRSETQYEVVMTLTDDAPSGPVNAQLVVSTDHPEAPKVVVKVYGVIRALLHVTPPQVQFGTVEAKAKPGRNVIVVNNRSDGSSTQVTSAQINDPAFEVEVSVIEEGRRYQVTVAVKPDAEPGVKDTVLVLATTDSVIPELTVPVRASIR
jgi:hypothetical protein